MLLLVFETLGFFLIFYLFSWVWFLVPLDMENFLMVLLLCFVFVAMCVGILGGFDFGVFLHRFPFSIFFTSCI